MRVTVAAAVACLGLVGITLGKDAEATIRKTTNIEPQALAPALRALAKQRDVQLVYRSDLVNARQTAGAAGELTLEEALTELLNGTGLTFQYLDDNAITVIPAAKTSGVSAVQHDGARAPIAAKPDQGKAFGLPFRLAQSEEASGGSQSRVVALEEVTVTGTRKELYNSRVVTSGVLGDKDPLDIPFSISSYTSELASLQGAYTPAEILKNDPAAQNQGQYAGYQNNVVLRGFAASAGGVRRDGLIVDAEGDFPIEAYDRVELIKGVAGFLYGFAQPGGIMNYVTKRPTQDSFASLDVRFRDGTGPYAHLDTGGPIADGRFGYRANLVYQDSDGYTHPADMRRVVGALAFDAKVSDALLLRLDASYATREQPGTFGVPLTTEGREPPHYDPDDLMVPPWARFNWKSSHVGLRANYTISDDWDLQVQVNRDRLLNRIRFSLITSLEPNGDFSELSFNVNPASRNLSESTTAQVVAVGKLSTGPIAHELAIGAFYQNLDGDFRSPSGNGLVVVTGNLFNVSFPTRPAVNAGPLGDPDITELRELQWFIGDTLHFGERWQMMLGARLVNANSSIEVWEQDDKVSPSAALLFKPNAATTLYGSYARSLQYSTKGPEVNSEGDPLVNPNALLAPIEAKQYEVGAKTRLASGMDLGLALYRIELPSDYVDEATNTYGRFGAQVNRGVELTMAGSLRPNLAVVAGLGYLDPELTRSDDPTLIGNRPATVARLTGNLFVNYGVPQVPGLSLNAGVYTTGSRYLDLQNQTSVAGYTRTDLGAQYRFNAMERDLTLRLNVNNVFNRFYWEGLGPFLHQYSPGQDRSYIVSAQMQLF